MKKTILTILMVSFAIVLTGCGGGGNGSADDGENPPKENQENGNSGNSSSSMSRKSIDEIKKVDSAGDDWGTVEGTITLKGDVPRPRRESAKENESCGFGADKRFVMVQKVETGKNNALKGCFVWLEGVDTALEGNLPSKNPTVDQKGCHFQPDRLIIQQNGKLTVKNSDPTKHNFKYTGSSGMTKNNINQNSGATDSLGPFKSLETVMYQCNVHPWMGGEFLVANHHAFAVTGDDGKFSFQVPPGDYKLKVKHINMDNAKSFDVTVEKGGTATKDASVEIKSN